MFDFNSFKLILEAIHGIKITEKIVRLKVENDKDMSR